ncbi:hypothetical protein FO519_010453, partial [Halicephalobus sp. NKZ332]
MWNSDKEPEQKILDLNCSYLIDFNENNEEKTIGDLWEIFKRHKQENIHKPIMGKLSRSSPHKNTEDEKVLVELFIQLKRVTNGSKHEPTEPIKEDYDSLFTKKIKSAVEDFNNTRTLDDQVKQLLYLEALLRLFIVQFFQYFKFPYGKGICCPNGIKKNLIGKVKQILSPPENHNQTATPNEADPNTNDQEGRSNNDTKNNANTTAFNNKQ